MSLLAAVVPLNLLRTFDPTAILTLDLAGTFVFGLSGALAGVRARLDAFGVLVLAVVVGLAGGVIRDVLIGRPPATFRDPAFLAVIAGATLVALAGFPWLERMRGAIEVLDAAGLGLFCVTGAAIARRYRLEIPEAIILGAISGIGGGMVRDLILREVPHVLRSGLYAVPALIGSSIAVAAPASGDHGWLYALLGASACFAVRVAAMRWQLSLPQLPHQSRAG
ncbi:MAG TPA: TRIC cation channel family protein [Solirubrobacteraceae bacterium]|nr:TRIC cation channel family protein [Solirubrobacteraceae bacterium]